MGRMESKKQVVIILNEHMITPLPGQTAQEFEDQRNEFMADILMAIAATEESNLVVNIYYRPIHRMVFDPTLSANQQAKLSSIVKQLQDSCSSYKNVFVAQHPFRAPLLHEYINQISTENYAQTTVFSYKSHPTDVCVNDAGVKQAAKDNITIRYPLFDGRKLITAEPHSSNDIPRGAGNHIGLVQTLLGYPSSAIMPGWVRQMYDTPVATLPNANAEPSAASAAAPSDIAEPVAVSAAAPVAVAMPIVASPAAPVVAAVPVEVAVPVAVSAAAPIAVSTAAATSEELHQTTEELVEDIFATLIIAAKSAPPLRQENADAPVEFLLPTQLEAPMQLEAERKAIEDRDLLFLRTKEALAATAKSVTASAESVTASATEKNDSTSAAAPVMQHQPAVGLFAAAAAPTRTLTPPADLTVEPTSDIYSKNDVVRRIQQLIEMPIWNRKKRMVGGCPEGITELRSLSNKWKSELTLTACASIATKHADKFNSKAAMTDRLYTLIKSLSTIHDNFSGSGDKQVLHYQISLLKEYAMFELVAHENKPRTTGLFKFVEVNLEPKDIETLEEISKIEIDRLSYLPTSLFNK